MKIELIDDAGAVLKRAWSVRFNVLATVCGVIEVVLPLWFDSMPRGYAAGLMLFFSLLGLYARFVKQPRMHRADK